MSQGTPGEWPARRRFLAVCVLGAIGVGLTTACRGAGVRANVSVGPRLTPARLGSVRSAMTYDGDWLGGISPVEDLAEDLELAARRGIDFAIDLRTSHARSVLPLEEAAQAAGIQLLEIQDSDPLPGENGELPFGGIGVSDQAVDAVRRILNAPGRKRSLLLDENGTRSSMVYAIHLTVDEGVAEAEALGAARATGLSQDGVEFVHHQVRRIRSTMGG